ncbi:cAMP-activated global transcriptional regulator CRP [Actinomadura rubteroloni]|uniref:cAMP-activated global transcriptional regulator CRP n=1 Tax=Actinomadura rubteroloni TaxID=1926885 RepID=A0A2P4UMN9_9ACTN|nr:Crp/Fnr family transcriptional regulator [Actinomadura rubteroloni]POM26313.1 cAMP-activated global transcriptional regulator CRP [Actinomadura rubteroloni]
MAFDASTWWRLARDGGERRFAARDVLMSQGGPPDVVHFLVSGRVKVTRHTFDGDVILLSVRGPGSIIGELSVLDGGRRSATVTALDACLTRTIVAERFRARVRELDLRDELLKGAIALVRENEAWNAELVGLAAGPRVVRTLLRLATPGPDGALEVVLDQTELGQAARLVRTGVAAELARLRRAGVIATGRRRIVLTDPVRLRALAGSGHGNV